MPDRIGDADKIVKISDADGKLAKEQGFKVFDTYEDAIKYRGSEANEQMNKDIKAVKYAETPEGTQLVASMSLPATYEALRHGEEPGFKEGSIDAALAAMTLIPGGRAARTVGAKFGLPILTSFEREIAARSLPSIVPKGLQRMVAQAPAVVAGETALAGAAEGLTSIGQDREFDPMNVAYGAAIGTGAAGILPGEQARSKALEAMKTVPGSELDKRLLKFGSSGIKPGVKLSKIANDEITRIINEIVKKEKLDLNDPKISEALKTRVKNLFTVNKDNLFPDDMRDIRDGVDGLVDAVAGKRSKGGYSARQLTKLPDLTTVAGMDPKTAGYIDRSVPVAVADALRPSESNYLLELGRLKSFENAIEKPVLNKVPILSPLIGFGRGVIGGAARGGRTYLPTLRGLEEKED